MRDSFNALRAYFWPIIPCTEPRIAHVQGYHLKYEEQGAYFKVWLKDIGKKKQVKRSQGK